MVASDGAALKVQVLHSRLLLRASRHCLWISLTQGDLV